MPFNPGWEWVVANLATVPVVSLCLGSVAGLGAARVVTSHYSVMVKGTSQLFVAGPPVVDQLGEDVDKETLGGSAIHTRNGAVDDEVATEAEAFARARAFLSYLPSSVDELPPRARRPRRRPGAPRRIARRRRSRASGARSTRSGRSSRRSSTADSFFELGRRFGGAGGHRARPARRLAGRGARQRSVPLRAAAGPRRRRRRSTRFVDLAETFRLPVVHLVDNPGFVIGTEAEQAATIRHGARALAAVYQATVPWCSVILRKVYGVAGAAHQNASRLSYRYAWPSGNWGSLPLEGGIEAAYRAQLEAADDPAALRAEIEQRLAARQSPFRTAEAFLVEEIIDPRDTRPLLCEFADLAAPLSAARAADRARHASR